MTSNLTPIGLISYFFPPVGMAGPARAYALFRYLPEFGYRPHVVTVKDIVYPAYDNTLLTETDSECIVRTESFDPARLLYRFGSRNAPAPNRSGVMSRYATPDFKKYWNGYALRAVKNLARTRDCRLFITTSPAPSTHRVGVKLKKQLGLTWVADFRDMWVTNPIESAYRSERQKQIARRLLGQYQRHADMMVAVNGSVAAYVGAEEVIENGADPDTFEIWDRGSDRSETDSVLRIGYFGATDQRDSIRLFCDSLKTALSEIGSESAQVETLFVGRVDDAMLREEFARVNLTETLIVRGYMPRPEGIKLLSSVDALLVTTPRVDSPHMTTSKVFDYLVSGKQIIALTAESSELARLLHTEHVATYSESTRDDLTARLKSLIAKREQGEEVLQVSADVLADRREMYSWRTLARRYAEALDRLLEKVK